MSVIKTKHAQARMQQRGISDSMLQLLLEYGKYTHDKRGAEIVSFNRKSRNNLKRDLSRKDYAQIERHLDVYTVITDDVIVTVGHRK